jgi:hypothetical protein
MKLVLGWRIEARVHGQPQSIRAPLAASQSRATDVKSASNATVHSRRRLTVEERSVQLLALFQRSGLQAALLAKAEGPRSDKRLLLMHALIAAMPWRLGEALALQRLARG